jgi:hypothetical protein
MARRVSAMVAWKYAKQEVQMRLQKAYIGNRVASRNATANASQRCIKMRWGSKGEKTERILTAKNLSPSQKLRDAVQAALKRNR